MSHPYSLFQHIGKAVFFGGFRDSFLMAVFSAYFDASGKKSTPVLTVAGFVSRVKKWDRFDSEWSAILAGEGVRSMHMTDFASSEREFKSWRGESERRRKFISALTDCINRNTNKGFAASVYISDYNEVDSEYMVRETLGHPFTLCARTCLGGLKAWAHAVLVWVRSVSDLRAAYPNYYADTREFIEALDYTLGSPSRRK